MDTKEIVEKLKGRELMSFSLLAADCVSITDFGPNDRSKKASLFISCKVEYRELGVMPVLKASVVEHND